MGAGERVGVPVSERLERVTDWAEVRPGGPVFKMVDCERPGCGKDHRFIVIAHSGQCPTGRGRVDFIPKATCGGDQICACSISTGKLFRVLDGLEEPSTETAAATGTTRRTPQKERVR